MIALVRESASEDQLAQLVRWIERRGFKAHVSRGDSVTIIGIIGDTTRMDPFLLESMDIIERVQRVSEPYKLASRTFHPADSIVDCGHGVTIGGGSFQIIARLCPAGGSDLEELALVVKRAGAALLQLSEPSPCDGPHSPQGGKRQGLDPLLEVGSRLGMPVIAKVTDVRDVAVLIDRGIDVLQVGGRDSQNRNLLREVGKTSIPVLVRRGVADTIDELLMAAEYVMSEGNRRVILCERGIRSFETRTRSTFDVGAIPVLHHLTHLPVIGDASRATGHARWVRSIAYAATAAGADGLEMEVRLDRDKDQAHGSQALTPAQFDDAARRAVLIRNALATNTSEEA